MMSLFWSVILTPPWDRQGCESWRGGWTRYIPVIFSEALTTSSAIVAAGVGVRLWAREMVTIKVTTTLWVEALTSERSCVILHARCTSQEFIARAWTAQAFQGSAK